MYIDCVTNSGKPYLRVAESYSAFVDGVRKNRKRTIRNIGPLSKYDDGKPDFLKRLKQSYLDGAPIIEGLSDLIAGAKPEACAMVRFNRLNPDECMADPKNMGYFLLDGLYDALGIYDVLNKHKSGSKLGYDLNGIARLLVFSRVLWPDSKAAAFEDRVKFLFGVTSCKEAREIYRALDCLNNTSEAIQRRMNTKIKAAIGRNTEVCFYDVTNYWFEIGHNDADAKDDKDNVLREGLRKKGVSKEKRGEPIVQMGLFIDDNGLPIAYKLFPGNHTDQTTLRPALEKSIDQMDFGRVIVVADGGLNSGPNIAHLLSKGNGYIVSKSVRKSDKATRTWILEEDGYEWNEARTFKVKSKIRQRKIKDAQGNTLKITEKLICYWSRKHYERELKENASFIEYLKAVVGNPDKLKDKQAKVSRFLRKTEVVKETGEVVETKALLSIDQSKVDDYMALLGYYTLMTSETEKTDQEIINKYHGLSRIEDSFRITKSELEGRPVYVRTPEHINAHFLICFIALTMIRLIQNRVLVHQGKATLNEDGWSCGITADRIQETLASFQADPLPGGLYRVTKLNDDMRLILQSMHLAPDLCLPTSADLRSLKAACDRLGLRMPDASSSQYC